MKPTIQIINVSSSTAIDSSNDNVEQLPFDISHVDGEDGLRAKFLEALSYDDLGPNTSLSHRFAIQTLSTPQIPPSKYPNGKENESSLQQTGGIGWFSSINLGSEGLLPEGWIEKHVGSVGADYDSCTNANDDGTTKNNIYKSYGLPSSLILLTTASEDRTGVTFDPSAQLLPAMEQIRSLLCRKRPTAVFVVCLVKSHKSLSGKSADSDGGAIERGEKILRQRRNAALQQTMCDQCQLPGENVLVLREDDLEEDTWEERVRNSPYGAAGGEYSVNAAGSTGGKIMSPPLRQLTASLLQSSSLYYAHLAEGAERKLSLWRNRYQTTNVSFDMNILICVLRCGRYAYKSGLLREMEGKCSNNTRGSTGGERNAHGHYEEAYRWVNELHRRVLHHWKSNSPSFSSAPSVSVTPGANEASNEFSSPKVTQSPGGGIGVELSLPPVVEAPSASPLVTSNHMRSDNNSFYSSLYHQSRAVAGLLNTKLMRCQNAMKDLESIWRRHRNAFMGCTDNDNFYGPLWYRILYCWNQMMQYADASEALWRKDATFDPRSLDSNYFASAAPWGVLGELAEVSLRLGGEVTKIAERAGWKDPENEAGSGKRFVGSIVGGVGVGSLKSCFEKESKKKHKELALEYTLHALALLKENDSICRSINDNETPESASVNIKFATPSAATRLHYLAGRLLMGQNDPESALPHLRFASEKTIKWPSMNLSIQRLVLDCERKCSFAQSKSDESARLILEPSTCGMLSEAELLKAKQHAISSDMKEVVWNDDEAGVARPPLEFAVTFLDSTHATSSETVLACLSLKSYLNIPVYVEKIQLNTTAGSYDVPNVQEHVTKEALQSWSENRADCESASSDVFSINKGIQLNASGIVYFFTEMKLPSTLVETAMGKTAADLSKFHPKNGKLCNMGFTMGAGNICKSRVAHESKKITIDGKPLAVSNLAEEDISFFGGIPLVCHGLSLMLKPLSNDDGSLMKLQVHRKHLLSPLGRSDALQYLMEECNYMSHSWSRPAHHPWHLGPRCLRVLSPRPTMEVTNLTETVTCGEAIEGTVNRIIFKLLAGEGCDCRDITIRLRCTSCNENANSALIDDGEEESKDTNSDTKFLFVRRSLDANALVTTSEGINIPVGWEPRLDVMNDESQDVSSVVVSKLGARETMLLPLDVFRPLNLSLDETADANIVSTSYEVILTYVEVRADTGNDNSTETGNQVMIVQRGTLKWIKPFTGQFSIIEDNQKRFPCGVQHDLNSVRTSRDNQSRINISADGERVRMRFTLTTNKLGGNVASGVESIFNEIESDQKLKELYSSGNAASFLAKQSAKLSISYCVTTQRDTPHSNEHVTLPLGVIGVNWKPTPQTLSDKAITESMTFDEYGLAHGPLSLTNISPMIFYGPQCEVLNSPFTAKLLKCPSPKVGVPFRVTYQIKNKTSKSQTLTFSLDGNSSATTSLEYLLITGKVKGEVQIAPFEEKSFPFTIMSMTAGKVECPSFRVSSGRHQSWVINEAVSKERNFFVMP